ELRRRGHRVRVLDPAPCSGATHAAAGMLAPDAEVWHGEPDLHAHGRASARLWHSWAERLGLTLHPHGTLLVGHDAADRQEVTRQADLLAGRGAAPRALDRRSVGELEPGLARVAGGHLLRDDLAVDPREAVEALRVRLSDVIEPTPGDLT